MTHKNNVDIDQKRLELERLYTSLPPMRLIYQILIGGTIGIFLAVIVVRYFFPDKVPQIIYPQQNYEQLAK